MYRYDENGREYTRLSELEPGDTVEIEGGFTCIEPGSKLDVWVDDDGNLFIHCSQGQHYLDGELDQEDEDDDYLVGIYKVVG